MEEIKYFNTTHSSINLTIHPFGEISILELCMFTFSFMSGLPTHSYVIWLIVTGTGSGIEFFNLNLSVCGIFFSVNSLLTLCINWFPFLSLMTLKHFLFGFAITGRPLFQCLICVERYLAVVHPVTFLKYKPLRYRVICSVIAWTAIVTSCGIVILPIFFLLFELLFGFILAQFILFLSIQFCCVAVLRALKQSGPGERGREKEEENHMKRRAFYVPYTVTVFLLVMKEIHIQIFWSISYICFMLAGLVLPVLFLHRTGKLSCLCSPKEQQL